MRLKKIISNSLIALSICLIALLVGGCGGSSDNDSPAINVASPAEGSEFTAGETFTLHLELDNFEFNRPDEMDPAVTGTQKGSLSVEHMVSKHESGDDHAADMTNPSARQGHVHIYLNDASGSDSHITAWASEVTVALPHNIAAGMNSLRIELRDNTHVKVGEEYDQTLTFKIVE